MHKTQPGKDCQFTELQGIQIVPVNKIIMHYRAIHPQVATEGWRETQALILELIMKIQDTVTQTEKHVKNECGQTCIKQQY